MEVLKFDNNQQLRIEKEREWINMTSFIYLAQVAGVIALIFAFYKAMTINKSEAGNDRMKEIASAIAEGARAF